MSKGWYGNKMGHSLASRGIRSKNLKSYGIEMKCKTCKHFDDGYCDEIGDEYDDIPSQFNNGMVGLEINVSDDTGLYIRVRVSENFGCVLHKSMEESL